MASSSATGQEEATHYELGYVIRLRSYNVAEAVVLQPRDQSLYRGALLQVYDASLGSHYLAVVNDVQESEPHPAPDIEALNEVLEAVEEAGTVDRYEALREILRPDSPLSYVTSVTVTLGLLGRLCVERGGLSICEGLGEALDPSRVVMSDIGRPPRPRSIVWRPDPRILEAILSRCREPAYLGTLRQLPGVRVYIDLASLNTHMAVIGQTGSGKTETVKRIVYEAARRWLARGTTDRGVLVMDVAGEYTGYPYTPPSATPLLDALASAGLSPRITIIVPYDPLYTRPAFLHAGLRAIALRIHRLYRVHPLVLLFEPRSAWPRSLAPRLSLPPRRLIRDVPALIVAAPLPDTLPVQLLLEIGGFREESVYTELLHEVLDEMGAYQYAPPATLLSDLALLAVDVESLSYPSSRSVSNALNTLCNRLPSRATLADALREAVSARTRFNERLIRHPEVWMGFLSGVGEPAGPYTLTHACRHTPSLVEEAIDAVARALYRIARSPAQTRKALARRLARVARLASPALTGRIAEALVTRVSETLTILHLAPPSVGGVSHPLVAWLLDSLFNRAVSNYNPRRRNIIVVEEAHNLAPSRGETFAKNVLVRYAREGRKWGLGLIVVTQRPSGVEPTILSQAATLIALRLTNPEDIQAVRTSVESVSASIVERLPDLDRGEAIVSGYAVPERRIPLLVKIEMVR